MSSGRSLYLLLAGLVWALAPAGLRAEPLPENLAGALAAFRADGPKGWSYTQVTEAGGETLEEAFDALRPEADRWTLVARDGRPPTAAEAKSYREGKSRRAGGATAPRLQDRIDPASATRLRSEGDETWWRFRLLPGGSDDSSAEHLEVTFRFHVPTLTVSEVVIASREAYSPVFGISIGESRTVMTYSLPAEGRPSLLQRVSLRVRGRAFWLKSLDQDMTVTYTRHQPPRRPGVETPVGVDRQ